MRCNSCARFTSHDDGDPEIQSDPDATEGTEAPMAEVRRVRVCADCGEELKEATLEITADDPVFTLSPEQAAKWGLEPDAYDPDHCPAQAAAASADVPDADAVRPPCRFTWEAEAENTDRVETKDRHGKPIKRARYMKTYYGASVSFEGTCEHCGATAQASGSDDVPASGMDELG